MCLDNEDEKKKTDPVEMLKKFDIVQATDEVSSRNVARDFLFHIPYVHFQ